MFSSVNALSLSPALCGLLLRKKKPVGGPLGVFFKGFNFVFDKSKFMKEKEVLVVEIEDYQQQVQKLEKEL